ncbi:hypothetical protein CF319_g5678 [Tilletia indica]|nr:hypothetical protein CF319_g5678 [Tilletia indica]
MSVSTTRARAPLGSANGALSSNGLSSPALFSSSSHAPPTSSTTYGTGKRTASKTMAGRMKAKSNRVASENVEVGGSSIATTTKAGKKRAFDLDDDRVEKDNQVAVAPKAADVTTAKSRSRTVKQTANKIGKDAEVETADDEEQGTSLRDYVGQIRACFTDRTTHFDAMVDHIGYNWLENAKAHAEDIFLNNKEGKNPEGIATHDLLKTPSRARAQPIPASSAGGLSPVPLVFQKVEKKKQEAERKKKEEAERARKEEEEAAEAQAQAEAEEQRRKEAEAEAEALAAAEAARIAEEQAAAERAEAERAAAEKAAAEEAAAERALAKQAAAERAAAEKAAAQKVLAEQAAAEKAAAEKAALELAERTRKEKEEADRRKREEVEKKKKKEELEKKKKEELERKKKDELEKKKKEEAEKKKKEEAEKKKKEEAAEKRKLEAERKKKVEAERKKKEEQEAAETRRKEKERLEAEAAAAKAAEEKAAAEEAERLRLEAETRAQEEEAARIAAAQAQAEAEANAEDADNEDEQEESGDDEEEYSDAHGSTVSADEDAGIKEGQLEDEAMPEELLLPSASEIAVADAVGGSTGSSRLMPAAGSSQSQHRTSSVLIPGQSKPAKWTGPTSANLAPTDSSAWKRLNFFGFGNAAAGTSKIKKAASPLKKLANVASASGSRTGPENGTTSAAAAAAAAAAKKRKVSPTIQKVTVVASERSMPPPSAPASPVRKGAAAIFASTSSKLSAIPRTKSKMVVAGGNNGQVSTAQPKVGGPSSMNDTAGRKISVNGNGPFSQQNDFQQKAAPTKSNMGSVSSLKSVASNGTAGSSAAGKGKGKDSVAGAVPQRMSSLVSANGRPTPSKNQEQQQQARKNSVPKTPMIRTLAKRRRYNDPNLEDADVSLPDIQSEYSDSEDEMTQRKRKREAEWMRGDGLQAALQAQLRFNADDLFGDFDPNSPPDLNRMMPPPNGQRPRHIPRSSSANWNGPEQLMAYSMERHAAAAAASAGPSRPSTSTRN